MRIHDTGDLDPIPFDNDPELVKWARYGVAHLKAQHLEEREKARPKLPAETPDRGSG